MLISNFRRHKYLNSWIFAYNINASQNKLMTFKKFSHFDKRKGGVRMVFEIDKKEMFYQSLLKNFHSNLVTFYEKFIYKKYFSSMSNHYKRRKENKKKGIYLENLFNSRGAICFLKLWQMKSKKKIQFYQKISSGVSKISFFLCQIYKKTLFSNTKKINEIKKNELMSDKFWSLKKKRKIFNFLSEFSMKNKKISFLIYNKILKIKHLSFLFWKHSFLIKKENFVKRTFAKKHYEKSLSKK